MLIDLNQPRSKASGATSRAVRVLDADPDLGAGIPREQWELATSASTAPVFAFERGPWRFAPEPEPGGFGALIVDGLILIRIDAGSRSHIEMLGSGDVISPWVGTGSELSTPSEVTASVVARARIALLDRRFALRTARWPEIHAGLLQRSIDRARRLSLQSAINALPRIEERVEVTLWELAYRFGRVTQEGIVLDPADQPLPARRHRGRAAAVSEHGRRAPGGSGPDLAHRPADVAASRLAAGDAVRAGAAERPRGLAPRPADNIRVSAM